MGKSRKDYEKYLNSISPDRDDERWIIGGKNRYCGRENYGTMIKRYDPIGFNVGYRKLLICSMMKNIRKKDGNLSTEMRRYVRSRKREKRYG